MQQSHPNLVPNQQWAVPFGSTYADLAEDVGPSLHLFVPSTPPVSDPDHADCMQVSANQLTRF